MNSRKTKRIFEAMLLFLLAELNIVIRIILLFIFTRKFESRFKKQFQVIIVFLILPSVKIDFSSQYSGSHFPAGHFPRWNNDNWGDQKLQSIQHSSIELRTETANKSIDQIFLILVNESVFSDSVESIEQNDQWTLHLQTKNTKFNRSKFHCKIEKSYTFTPCSWKGSFAHDSLVFAIRFYIETQCSCGFYFRLSELMNKYLSNQLAALRKTIVIKRSKHKQTNKLRSEFSALTSYQTVDEWNVRLKRGLGINLPIHYKIHLTKSG